jgi:hypothetical protein
MPIAGVASGILPEEENLPLVAISVLQKSNKQLRRWQQLLFRVKIQTHLVFHYL